MTSPFYFWPKGTQEPGTLQSEVSLSILSPTDKKPIEGCSIEIEVNGSPFKIINLKNGKGKFTMPVNSVLKITRAGYSAIHRTLYLDYPPHRQIIEQLARGKWRDKYDSTKTFNPGEVPWEAFQFQKTKEVLSKVDWKIEMKPNERDAEWIKFEKVFTSEHN